MPNLLSENQEQILKTIEKINQITQKDLVLTKTNPPTNQEQKNYHKKCKSNLKDTSQK